MKPVFIAALLMAALAVSTQAARADDQAQDQAQAKDQAEYGMVVINNHSEKAGLAPVVFDHWLHRSMYTCRLCHVDIGFAMEANATNITADSNAQGFHCGACHNGKYRYWGKAVFASCSNDAGADRKLCARCHSKGLNVKKEYDFAEYTRRFPRWDESGWIDWEKAETLGYIKPMDYIEGVSIKRPSLKPQKDFAIESRGTWMSDVIFSHKKHAVWNGCEVCHPDIFPSVRKGETKFTMLDIYDGEYCGVCHNKVAFPLIDCQRCHTGPVQ